MRGELSKLINDDFTQIMLGYRSVGDTPEDVLGIEELYSCVPGFYDVMLYTNASVFRRCAYIFNIVDMVKELIRRGNREFLLKMFGELPLNNYLLLYVLKSDYLWYYQEYPVEPHHYNIAMYNGSANIVSYLRSIGVRNGPTLDQLTNIEIGLSNCLKMGEDWISPLIIKLWDLRRFKDISAILDKFIWFPFHVRAVCIMMRKPFLRVIKTIEFPPEYISIMCKYGTNNQRVRDMFHCSDATISYEQCMEWKRQREMELFGDELINYIDSI